MKTKLKNYARLAVRVGANVQEGQDVWLYCSVDQAELARLIVKEAYAAGAAEVRVEWLDDAIDRLHYQEMETKRLGHISRWQLSKLKYQSQMLPAIIHIVSQDPEALKGIDQKKIMDVSRLRYLKTKKYRDAMDNKYQWTILGAASAAWAKRVFPGQKEKEAIHKLWHAIFDSVHMSGQDDLLKIWAERNEAFHARAEYLNKLKLKTLHYKAANGTDFRVGLLPGSIWAAGGEKSEQGIYFNPNLPTEECFTTPDKNVAEGIVYASKALSVRGELIENFWMRFEKGQVVDFAAEKGENVLRFLIESDPGAARLGEVALVPHNSPISQSGILYYNTLYDENASSHLALGKAYTANVQDYAQYSEEERSAMGVNDSMIHVDFMIGTADMKITGERYHGEPVEIFRDGNWAFDL